MHILIWVLAALALGCWTLLAWATAWVLGLDPSLLDNLAANIDLWLPGWQPAAVATLQITRELFAALGGIGTWLVWGAWAVGAVLVVGCAALGSVVVMAARRAMAPRAAAAPGQA